MSDDIVTRLRLRPTILRKNQFGDMETDRAATALFDECHAIMRDAADEIERLRAERDEIRLSYCLLMEAYRGGDGRVTANKLGWGYLFAEDSK